MRRLSYAGSALAAVKILRAACLGALVLLSTLVFGSPSASALPADGSNCKSDWVYNPRAMACFIQGEEDARNGVRHPHYVACTQAGEVFCCVNNDSGAQNCEAVRKGGRHNIDVPVGALLQAQQTILTILGRISDRVDKLESRIGDLNRCAEGAERQKPPVGGSR